LDTRRGETVSLWRRRPPSGLLHHCDRSSQYACARYQRLLEQHGMTPSMSRKDNCWDNSPVERFFGSLNRERTDVAQYATRQQAKAAVIDCIEMFYNDQRRLAKSVRFYLTVTEELAVRVAKTKIGVPGAPVDTATHNRRTCVNGSAALELPELLPVGRIEGEHRWHAY